MSIAELNDFVEELIVRSKPHDYFPSLLMQMIDDYGVVEAISKLVVTADIQTGFRKLRDLGLLDWTIEAAVRKYPAEFEKDVVECAIFRLDHAYDL